MAPPPQAQLPPPGEVVGRGVNALVALRPTVEPHLSKGRWGDVVQGVRGQFDVAKKRLAEECLAARLPFAEGQALTDLAASEYETQRAVGAIAAVGELVIVRKVIHFAPVDQDISTPAAEDEATTAALLTAIVAWLQAHESSVYDPSTGLGAHFTADPGPVAIPALGIMSTYVAAAEAVRAAALAHFAGTGWHLDADTVESVSPPTAFSDDPALSWTANNLQSRSSVMAVVNATKSALNAHARLASRAGAIRANSKWTLVADPLAVPQVTGGQYAAQRDVPVGVGVQSATIPILATKTGASGNVPSWVVGGPVLRYIGPVLFDTQFSTVSLRAAGGSDGQTDPELRRASGAASQGKDGPTIGALVAGALRTTGASQTVVLEDPLTGAAVVYPADQAWSQSDAWNNSVELLLRGAPEDRPWLGFGCLLRIGAVRNRIVRPEVTVVLRDASYLADTSGLTVQIQRAVKDYFDNRRDWYIWRSKALRGIVSGVDKIRISTCSSLIVRDESGAPLSEPAQPSAGSDIVHWVFADGAVQITYSGPV